MQQHLFHSAILRTRHDAVSRVVPICRICPLPVSLRECPLLREHLLINHYVLRQCYGGLATADRQPLDGVFIEEGPGWDDGDKGNGSAGKANLEGQRDVLGEIADEEGNGLFEKLFLVHCVALRMHGRGRGRGAYPSK